MSETLRASEGEKPTWRRSRRGEEVPFEGARDSASRMGGFPPAPQTVVASCVFGLVLRRAAQTPYRIGRLSATLASHE